MKSFIKKLSTIALLGFVMSSSVFATHKGGGNGSGKGNPLTQAASQDITVNGNYGVLITLNHQGANDPLALNPLTPIAQNSDHTYTLHTSDQGTRYYLADASGKTIGDYQVGPAFAGKSTWTLNADGKTSTIS